MDSQPQQPSTPQAPSLSEQIQQYISTLPSILGAQQQYGPAFEQAQFDLQSRFAPQYKALQDSLYPELARLRTSLAETAQSGMNGQLPDNLRNQYLDQYRAEIGGNNGAGIGADYVSRGLLNDTENYRNNFRNLALTLTGQQPLYQASQAGQSFNAGAGYNPGQALNYGQSIYGDYVRSYAGMYGTNAQYGLGQQKLFQDYIFGAARGVGGAMGGH